MRAPPNRDSRALNRLRRNLAVSPFFGKPIGLLLRHSAHSVGLKVCLMKKCMSELRRSVASAARAHPRQGRVRGTQHVVLEMREWLGIREHGVGRSAAHAPVRPVAPAHECGLCVVDAASKYEPAVPSVAQNSSATQKSRILDVTSSCSSKRLAKQTYKCNHVETALRPHES